MYKITAFFKILQNSPSIKFKYMKMFDVNFLRQYIFGLITAQLVKCHVMFTDKLFHFKADYDRGVHRVQ